MFLDTRKFSPIGEYIRLLVLQRLAYGPATVNELSELVCTRINELSEKTGIKYNCMVWPELLKYEVEIKDGMAYITSIGQLVYKNTTDEVIDYLRKWRLA